MGELWTEKYRPRDFSEFKGQEKIADRVKAMVEQKNIMNMLFAGPAGCGKTTLALIVAKKLYGEYWKSNFLETNASTDRGIDVVRNRIKDFARAKALGTNLPKIIYLDECDSLTMEAQQALRRTMESFSNTARFILSCNFSSKLIIPIKSRCAIFTFKPLEKAHIKEIIENIEKNEKISVDKKAVETLYEVSEGDVRKMENILQSCSTVSKKITEDTIYEIMATAKPKEIREALQIALNGDFSKAREKLLDIMLKNGLSGLDVIKTIQKEIWNLSMPDEKKILLIDKCGEIEFRMVEGSDEFVQLEALLANFIK